MVRDVTVISPRCPSGTLSTATGCPASSRISTQTSGQGDRAVRGLRRRRPGSPAVGMSWSAWSVSQDERGDVRARVFGGDLAALGQALDAALGRAVQLQGVADVAELGLGKPRAFESAWESAFDSAP